MIECYLLPFSTAGGNDFVGVGEVVQGWIKIETIEDGTIAGCREVDILLDRGGECLLQLWVLSVAIEKDQVMNQTLKVRLDDQSITVGVNKAT